LTRNDVNALAERPTNEAAALAALAGRGAAGFVGLIEETHTAIAGRVSKLAGNSPLHGLISGAIYGSMRTGGAVIGRSAAFATRALPAEQQAISRTPAGSLAVAALNGFLGDRFEQEKSPLALGIAVRRDHRDVDLDAASLAEAFPDARPRIAIFLHGLCESEDAFRLREGPRGGTYGSKLERDLGITPIFVRYNTGLHVSENGRRLSDLLEILMDEWPVHVADVTLIGHSMGGLVARSACHAATELSHDWIDHVRATVALATPHHGAPLEKAVNVAGHYLRKLPETVPLAKVLELRSEGIRDLRFGSLTDADWRDRDPHARLLDERSEIPLMVGARHHVVAATVTRDPRHPLGRFAGDTLVREDSASGRHSKGRSIAFDPEYLSVIGGTTHLSLLNHPVAYDLIRRWLTPKQLPAGPA
jgi:pimeloyl-ACP methyl ester carboxylesterase